MYANDIDQLIEVHLHEASGGLKRCRVSELSRGQCTSRPYFIFKIDLAASTVVLRNTKPAEYARIAHAYLSTVDAITQQFGAEPEQTDYQGDSVLAFFPERGNSVEAVVTAAVVAHYAVGKLRQRVSVPLHPRLLLHFAPLTVAKIGPWSESHRVAIGLPIHYVAKKENDVRPGAIWLSNSCGTQCASQFRMQFLQTAYVERIVMEKQPVAALPSPVPTLASLVSNCDPRYVNAGLLSGAFGQGNSYATHAPSQHVDKPIRRQVEDGHYVKLASAYQALKLPQSTIA